MESSIRRADFTDPSLASFIAAHHQEMAPLSPPESQHALDVGELDHPGVRLWCAEADDQLVGTIALAQLERGHEELKSMRVTPRARGTGLGKRLLAHALADALTRGVERISLETGTPDYFDPARRLYTQAGFVECAPFGSYVEDPESVFMTMLLT